MKNGEFIIEIGACQQKKFGRNVCGDTFLSKKVGGENRYVAVLSDGLGSGIKASVLSTLTASMAMNFRLMHEPVIDSARWVMDTLPFDSERNASYSTFTIADVDFEGCTTLIEYGNPPSFIERGGQIICPERTQLELEQDGKRKVLEISVFNLMENDRLVMVSDGITQSGIGNAQMPFGWGNENLYRFVTEKVHSTAGISAGELARAIVRQAERNDISRLKDDTSCAVIYRRQPRELMVCSGPPFNNGRDGEFAATVGNFAGKKIVCGGTTSKIIARELHEEIRMAPLEQMKDGLPPSAEIKGIDLVTEGILTLGKVAELLSRKAEHEIPEAGPAGQVAGYLLNADIIHFLVGTCINIAHQDPNLPVELDIRRNIIRRIACILEDRYLKQVSIKYL